MRRRIRSQRHRRDRVLADAAQPQAPGRARQEDRHQHHQQRAQEHDSILVAERLADQRQVGDARQVQTRQACHRRVAIGAAGAEHDAQQEGGEAGGKEIEADADDDRIAPQLHDAHAEDGTEQGARDECRQHATGEAAGEMAAGHRRESAHQHLAFESDVEEADPLAQRASRGPRAAPARCLAPPG